VNAVNAKHADNHPNTKRGNNQANARRVDGLNAKDANRVNAKPVDKSSLRAGANARRVDRVNAKGAARVNTKPAEKSSPLMESIYRVYSFWLSLAPLFRPRPPIIVKSKMAHKHIFGGAGSP
jgi:hypothetical protein